METKTKILYNQTETDLQHLKEDVEAGVYKHDIDSFLREAKRIHDKIEEVKRLNKDKTISHCPKCGNEVLGDEDGFCSWCV